MPADGAGSSFGQYELIARLGRGGMGETWKARRRGLRDAPTVVVKRMLPDLADDPELIESFVNEAKLTASLSHPNIAQVLDFGQVEGEYFFVIELVQGRTLEALLGAAAARGLTALPPAVACAVVLGMLDALEYAHHRRDVSGRPLEIVHRDISPDNVLLSFDGEVKLVDFGVAKARWKGRANTQTGLVKGKYRYMSPEQARGEPLDGRSDLFAVGVVLYRLLSGVPPFAGTWPEGAQKLLRGDYVPLEVARPGLPTGVTRVVARALETNREKRFQSAALMAQGLRTQLEELGGFDRAALRAFVHWAHEDELVGEGLEAAVPRAQAERIRQWLSLERQFNTGALLPAQADRTSARPTEAHARTSSPKPRRDFRLFALLGLFGAGALAAGWVASRPTQSDAVQVSKRAQGEAALRRADATLVAAPQLNPATQDRTDQLRNEVRALRAITTPDEQAEQTFLDRALALERVVQLQFDPVREQQKKPAALDSGALPLESTAAALPPVVQETPDVGRPAHDVVRLPPGRSSLRLALSRYNLLDIPFPPDAVYRSPTPVNVEIDKPRTPMVVLVEQGPVLSRATFEKLQSQRTGVTTVRFIDFRPLPSNGLDRVGTFMVSGGAGALVSRPAFRVRSSHGHHVQLQGLEKAMWLELRLREQLPPAGQWPWVVLDCDGKQELLETQARFLWPKACALAVVAPAQSQGEAVVEVSLTTSELSAIPPPRLDDDLLFDARRRPDGGIVADPQVAGAVAGALLEGRAALRRREADRAVSHLTNCVTRLADSVDCHRLLAHAHFLAGSESAAVKEYRTWVALAPGDPDARIARAVLSRLRPDLKFDDTVSPREAELISRFSVREPPPGPRLTPTSARVEPQPPDVVRGWACDERATASQPLELIDRSALVTELRFSSGERLLVSSTSKDRKALQRLRAEVRKCDKVPKRLGATRVQTVGFVATVAGPVYPPSELVWLEELVWQ